MITEFLNRRVSTKYTPFSDGCQYILLGDEHQSCLQAFTVGIPARTTYEWIMKYTQYATDSIKNYQPKVANVWIADETVSKIDGQNVWFWNLIDYKTRYLSASS